MAEDYVSDNEEVEEADEEEASGSETDDQQEEVSEVDDSLEMYENVISRPGKRSHEIDEVATEEPKPKSKKLSKDLFKPPTAEEMNQLRETENLFHSNLFRLQIEEMLKEVTVKAKYRKKFDIWFQEFTSFLDNLEVGEQIQLSDLSWLQKLKIELPIEHPAKSMNGFFQFEKPSGVAVIGSYAADCRLGPDIQIDIKVEMPQKCTLKSDYQHRRVMYKRALYTSYLASKLGVWAEANGVQFSLLDGDPLKPVIHMVPVGKLGKHTTIRILVVPNEGCFKLSHFHPEKSNVKSRFVCDSNNSSDLEGPTPHYNRSVALDLVISQNEQMRLQALENHQSIREGIMLLKVWLRQRSLDQGYGSFNGFIMSMYVLYLLKTRRLNTIMSSYQVVRNTWNNLAQSNWTEEGITLFEESEYPIALKDFHMSNAVVFVDVTGYVNFTGNMSKATFLTVKKESALAVKCLDNPNINSFQVLFMSSMPFYRQFDHIIRFHDLKALKKAEESVGNSHLIVDCAGPWLARDAIVDLLCKGLGQRVSQLAVQLQPMPVWSLDKKPPKPQDVPLTLGLSLDPEHAFSFLEKGPVANCPEAEEFRKFWGEKCELRRFRDGTICESVVWPSGGLAHRRLVCRDIVLYLANIHLGVKPSAMLYIADQLEQVLSHSKREEGSVGVTEACNSLGRQLMQLEGLPLTISSVQGSAACLRYSEPFPPTPFVVEGWKSEKKIKGKRLSATGVNDAKYVPPVPVVLTMGLSSKWPEDLEAIKRIKAAFYIKIAQCLVEQSKLTTQAYANYVDVLKDGFVFRLSVNHPREISLLKETTNPLGQIKYKDTDESIALEMEISHLPKLTATLHGMHMLYPTLGPASCLAKRWVAAHMLLDPTLMPEICIELIMASLFLAPEPYNLPLQPQSAFVHFLQKIAANTWQSEPLIVNFNNDIPREEVIEIENRFSSERASLPPLFIATPECRSGCVWTKKAPTTQVLYRLAQLAQSSLNALDSQLLTNAMDHKMIFRTPVHIFDVVVKVNPYLTRHEEAIDGWVDKSAPLKATGSSKKKVIPKIPIVGLDFVKCFVQDLRDAYDNFALFFYDQYGGFNIGVLLKPNVCKPKEFKVSQIDAQKPKPPNRMEFNIEAFLDDICVLGEGLVESVKVKGKDGKLTENFCELKSEPKCDISS